MGEHTLYFIPLSELSETQGTWFGMPTGTMFPSLEVPNILTDNAFGNFTPATLELTGTPTQITINDDDDQLNDEEATAATLSAPISGVPGADVGDVVEALYAYQLTGSDGSVINITVVDIETDGSYSPDGIVADQPLVPGVTYTVTDVYDWLSSPANPPYDTLVPCFTPDTLIETEHGPLPVQVLTKGDLVRTKDNGMQAIRWIGTRQLTASDLAANPNLAPIRVRAGALGAGLPYTDLVVSPQHRLLVRSRIAQRMFDTDEVLVAAKHLTALDGIDPVEDASGVTYVHFLLERHEIVFANGAETESLYTGTEALKSVPQDAADEILSLFPDLKDGVIPEPARDLIKGARGRQLAKRHAKNAVPLFAA